MTTVSRAIKAAVLTNCMTPVTVVRIVVVSVHSLVGVAQHRHFSCRQRLGSSLVTEIRRRKKLFAIPPEITCESAKPLETHVWQ